ncbi:hypothetical protein A3I42_02290 [Candidatus Uhrbacteria bacterium RIFCSPLOWO2_02_FULL_49_11]|uniref:Uncharacterized protein n=1 Tax=Candidatus Uhrbacteria bacterium RIFCSPLOWO2_02_FULL_49_11 TaxID=1802409 RepID=A0A1F7VER4_9BACT|nr:MAG: hypothetical protein A3I42_02290 [Candidatus Uhrbacteria bacterium RIFCSPLOWO2_02_FULL_49_11]
MFLSSCKKIIFMIESNVLNFSYMSKSIQFFLLNNVADNSGISISQHEGLRPGETSASFLIALSHSSYGKEILKHLSTHFFAAHGSLDAALEHAGSRVNELNKDTKLYTENICTLAYSKESFAITSGGECYAYLFSQGNSIEICQSEYSVGRKKIFTEFVAGAHQHGAILITFKIPAKSDLAQLAKILNKGNNNELQRIIQTLGTAALIRLIQKKSIKDRALHLRSKIRSLQLPKSRKDWIAVFTIFKNGIKAGAALFKQSSHRKRIMIAAIALLVLISLRIIFISMGSKNVERIIAETVRREAQIESLMKDNKEKNALELIDATLALLNAAPQHLSDTQASTIRNLRTRLAQRAASINKLSIIADPKPVVSIEKSFREAHTFDLMGLALTQGKLYTVNRAEGAIYEFDGKERRIVVMTDLPSGAGKPVDIIASIPGIVMVLTENPLGVLNLDAEHRTFQFSPLTLPRASMLPIAYATYLDRIYLLDARSRSIYRFERTMQGYNLWSSWSEDDSLDLSQATTFAIDGSIYVTFTDHSIIRLEKGKRVPFALRPLQPPLENVKAIATKEDSPYLYLLDQPQRRVVVILKKDGSLVAQYTSPQFTELRGLYPDEAARRIYVLNGNAIYSVGPGDPSITNN